MQLRTYFQKLFDAGLVTVTPELRVRLSDKVQEQYFNRKSYYRLHDKQLAGIPECDNLEPNTKNGILRYALVECQTSSRGI